MKCAYSFDCPLCRIYEERHIPTVLYYEDEHIIVVDCITCRVPMVVLKEHKATLSLEALESIAVQFDWGKRFTNKRLRTQMRQVPEHWHGHFV